MERWLAVKAGEVPEDSERRPPELALVQEDQIPAPNEIGVVSVKEGFLPVHYGCDDDLPHRLPLPNETFACVDPAGRRLDLIGTSTRCCRRRPA